MMACAIWAAKGGELSVYPIIYLSATSIGHSQRLFLSHVSHFPIIFIVNEYRVYKSLRTRPRTIIGVE